MRAQWSGLRLAPTTEAVGAPWPTWLALVHRDVGARILRTEIVGAGADQAVIVELLNHVRGPSADAGDCEDRRKQIHIDAQGVIRRCRVEIDIRVQFLFRLYELFDFARHLKPLRLPTGMPQVAGHNA